MKSDTFAQRERPGQTIARHRPARRERGLDVGGAVAERDKPVEYLPRDERRGALDGGGRIERRRDTRDADAQLFPRLGERVRAAGDDEDKRKDEPNHHRRDHRHLYTLEPAVYATRFEGEWRIAVPVRNLLQMR